MSLLTTQAKFRLKSMVPRLLPQSSGLHPRAIHVRFLVDQVAVWQGFSECFGFFCPCHSIDAPYPSSSSFCPYQKDKRRLEPACSSIGTISDTVPQGRLYGSRQDTVRRYGFQSFVSVFTLYSQWILFYNSLIYVNALMYFSTYQQAACLVTGPQPRPEQFSIVRHSVSSFNFQYFLVSSRLFSCCLRLFAAAIAQSV